MTTPMFFEFDGVRVPRFLYGTAWKEDATQQLTEFALRQGFRGIDTANQRKHYHEAEVGRAISAACASGLISRADLFLQTKFTFQGGQDHRLPYDPKAPVATQVEQSLANSLEHLGVEYVDSLLLHGPSTRVGLGTADRDAWRAMEEIHDRGLARLLGVSNVTLEQLDRFHQESRVPPRFVQNRCYASRGWDRPIRKYCAERGMIYQGFSLLTANRDFATHPELKRIADRHGKLVTQILFRYALDVGMIPLTGTANPEHMRQDLGVFDFQLDADEIEKVENLAGP